MRDTKLEKTNHEATPKHQGNLKRSLRDLHKGHEREERDKQRAKDEVDRLNGVVTGAQDRGNPWERKPAIPQVTASTQATPADRKKQLQQLAEMGVAVPDDFRKEMAMAGDWQVTSQRIVHDNSKKAEDEDIKPERLAVGVRKRKFEGQEEEEEAGETVVRRGWGSTTRICPGANDGEDDLDALLNGTKASKWDESTSTGKKIGQEGHADDPNKGGHVHKGASDVPLIKRKESLDTSANPNAIPAQGEAETAFIKSEQNAQEPEVVFKKRKAKPIRQK